jgi:hypothetical protein
MSRGSKLDSFDTEVVHDLLCDDSSSSSNEDDADLDACIRGLASLSRGNMHRSYVGRGWISGRGRGRENSSVTRKHARALQLKIKIKTIDCESKLYALL